MTCHLLKKKQFYMANRLHHSHEHDFPDGGGIDILTPDSI